MEKQQYLELIERTLAEVLPSADERPSELSVAMRYAVGTGGKRVRPLLCLASAVAVGAPAEAARYPAIAIELLHNYTLVHDDLPAMDNDVERRGQPTVWKRFGEAQAILVGDALQALAFGVASRTPCAASKVVAALSRFGVGVVAGQVEDIKREQGGASEISFVYQHKTADLFCAAAEMGALAGGGSSAEVAQLSSFAFHLGLAFQYEDDLLDGDSPFSQAETEARVQEQTAAALAALEGLPGETAFLRDLANQLVGRTY